MRLAICVATMKEYETYPGDIPTWLDDEAQPSSHVYVLKNTEEKNLGVVGTYDVLYRMSGTKEVLLFLHDDVICREQGWNTRLLKEFEDEKVGVVGFGGALWHGVPELYKVPYELSQLRRGGYRSNVDDAEVHGERFEGSCDAAVVDGFAIAVRRSLLDRIGGWSTMVGKYDYFNYDYAICGLARRYGYRIRVVGVRCHHRGGGTSVGKDNPYTSQAAYDRAHRLYYEEFMDVMPYQVR